MNCHLYLRQNIVFVPTSGKVHKRLYRDIEPVAVVPVSDTDAIRQALHATIARGNPPTPHYPRDSHPQPVVLKYAGLKSWHAFARSTSTWTMKEKDGHCQIVGYKMDTNGWTEDPDQKVEFPSGTTLDDIIDRMIAIIQEAARR